MNKIINGKRIAMSPEEIAECERIQAEAPAPEPTPEERLAALESENEQLKEALDMLLSGVVDDDEE